MPPSARHGSMTPHWTAAGVVQRVCEPNRSRPPPSRRGGFWAEDDGDAGHQIAPPVPLHSKSKQLVSRIPLIEREMAGAVRR
jgi:hypothetical protein